MIHAWESVAESAPDGQSASDRFADLLRKTGGELAGAGTHLPRVRAVQRALRSAEGLLRRPLRMALLGEANVGKSTLINLLLGNAVIPTLQLSNTRIPTLIRYAEQPSVSAVYFDGRILPLVANGGLEQGIICAAVGLPIPHLRFVEIMDFPGFSDPWLGYGDSDVARYRIDAPLWCTFSTQAWKESERAVWSGLPKRMREHALLVVTNKDLLRDEQAEKVLARLEKIALDDFRGIALVSSSKALRALDGGGVVKDEAQWQHSGAADLFARIAVLLTGVRSERLKRVQTFVSKITGKALHDLSAHELTDYLDA
jgi:hypothetical protein